MPYRILLLEDDEPLRHSLREVMRTWGYRVFATGRGAEAIDLARTQRLDFSLLDLHVPGMHGTDVLRVIRSEIGPMPSIVMSGEASEEEASLVKALGAFEFLRKPLELARLRSSFDHLIRHHFGNSPGSGPGQRGDRPR